MDEGGEAPELGPEHRARRRDNDRRTGQDGLPNLEAGGGTGPAALDEETDEEDLVAPVRQEAVEEVRVRDEATPTLVDDATAEEERIACIEGSLARISVMTSYSRAGTRSGAATSDSDIPPPDPKTCSLRPADFFLFFFGQRCVPNQPMADAGRQKWRKVAAVGADQTQGCLSPWVFWVGPGVDDGVTVRGQLSFCS